MNFEKIYEVEFIEYTDYEKDCVSNNESDIGKAEYIHTDGLPFLVKESELSKYSKFGKGYRKITLVGVLPKDTITISTPITINPYEWSGPTSTGTGDTVPHVYSSPTVTVPCNKPQLDTVTCSSESCIIPELDENIHVKVNTSSDHKYSEYEESKLKLMHPGP